MATSRKTDKLCPECGSEDTGNTLHANTYEFECGTNYVPAEFYAGPTEFLRVLVACHTIKAMRRMVEAVQLGATRRDGLSNGECGLLISSYKDAMSKVHDD